METYDNQTRRAVLRGIAVGAAAWLAPGAFADELIRTPAQTEGPFYPDKLPLDTDNDLIVVNDGLTPAVGEITYLTGRVVDTHGDPIRGATVEIWQADSTGVYLHTGSSRNAANRDRNFQGYGRFLTGATGEYLFRTIKPVAYSGRTRHIHVKVRRAGKELLTTEFYVKGEPRNDTDGVYNSVRDPKLRALLTTPFVPLKGSKAGELAARVDIVLGASPDTAPKGS